MWGMLVNNKEHVFLEQLVTEMHDLLLNFARIKIHDYHSAYDVVQEAYLAAQKNIHKLILSENPQGWLIETLKYKVLHEKRTRAKFFMLVEKLRATVSNKAIPHDGESLIAECLKKDEYEVLHLLFIKGYDIKEIAEMLNISYEACKKRVQAAKRKLAKEIQ